MKLDRNLGLHLIMKMFCIYILVLAAIVYYYVYKLLPLMNRVIYRQLVIYNYAVL